ncbi:MAG: hypothetical protein ABEH35_09075 [Haloarculaceae archaeon]
MVDTPRPDRWDAAAVTSAAAVLAVAYLVVDEPIVQYGAWLVVFCIWMAWFMFFGSKWLWFVET